MCERVSLIRVKSEGEMSVCLWPCGHMGDCVTLIRTSMAVSEASWRGVVVTSGKEGMMKGEASPCTGTHRAVLRTDDNFCRSAATNRVLMCSKSGGNVWTRAVRKAWEGTYTPRSGGLPPGEEGGGFVALAPMFNQTFHAAVHRDRSRSLSSPLVVLGNTLLTSSDLDMTTSEGGFIKVNSSSDLSFVSLLICRISWNDFSAARETSALLHIALVSMYSSNNDHALGKSPG